MFVPEIYLKRWQSFLPHMRSAKVKVFSRKDIIRNIPTIDIQAFDGEVVWSHTEPSSVFPTICLFGQEIEELKEQPNEDYKTFKERRRKFWEDKIDVEIAHLEELGCHEGQFLRLVEIATEET